MKIIFFTVILLIISSANSYAQDSITTPSMMMKINNELKLKHTYKEKTNYLKDIAENLTREEALIGEDSESYMAIQSLLSLARIKQDTSNIIVGLYSLLKFHTWNYRSDESKKTGSTILKILNNKEKTAREYEIWGGTYNYLAYIYKISNEYSAALENGLLSNEILTNPQYKIKNKSLTAANFMVLSNIYSKIDREEEAFNSISNVLKIYKQYKENNQGKQDKILAHYGFTGNISIGNYYRDFKKDIDKALYHYNEAKKIGKEIENEDLIINAETFKAIAYYKLKKYDKAIELFKYYLKLQKQNGKTFDVMYQYYYIARALRKQKKNNETIKYIDSALFLYNSQKIHVPSKKSSLLLSKVSIYIEKKDYDKALVNLKESLALSEAENFYGHRKLIYRNFYNIYNLLNEDKKCIFYYNKYSEVEAKLETKSRKEEVKVLEANFKYREIKSKLESEKVMLQLSLLKQKKIKTYSFFALTLIVISVFFILIIKDRQKKRATAEKLAIEVKKELLEVKKEALDREVEFKDRNITNFALQIHENNELLEKMKTPLKRLKKVVSGNNRHKKILVEINSLINGYIDKNNEKIQLYSNVDENVDNFELKIHEGYSNLTEKEREIIKKIRLGKTSKEIARELNIGAASVDNYRYIIRKKMRVPKGESLELFIKKI